MRQYVTFGQVHSRVIGTNTLDKDCVAVQYLDAHIDRWLNDITGA